MPSRWPLLVAAVMATIGWIAAPDPWPTGEALLTVEVDGTVRVEDSVDLGSLEPLLLESGRTRIAFEAGVPVDRPIEATITAPTSDPGSVSVRLDLADGRTQRIPILRYDDDTGTFSASRRPPVDVAPVLALLGFVVVMWVTEAIPLFVTSLLIPVVIVVSGAGSANDALAPFFHPIIALFFGGFLMAEAMRRVRLDHLAAISLVSWAGRSPAMLLIGMMAVSAFLSMWMSNTAAAAVLVPIALSVTAPIAHPGYRRVAVLGIAYAATLGGVGSAIGTPANPLAIEFLESFAGRSISFAEWFGYGLPMVIVFLPVLAGYLWWRMGVTIDAADFAEVRRESRAELHRTGRLDRAQMTVLAVFAAVMLVWLTQTFHGLNTGIVAVGGAVALAILGKIVPEDLGRISWSALLTFGGGLTLGLFLTDSGASDWLAGRLAGLGGVPSWVGVTVVAAVALGLTTVASNTATAAMMIPLAIPLAGILGIDPTLLVLVVAVASSIDFALVIGTPPTMIAYSTGLFSSRDIFRIGIVLDLIGIGLLVTIVTAIWRLLGLI
ncbi:MAG: SLC13 family permease [Acidimicrobiia bacterium]|nr:SLC13 family permease [Acidimicrobiia bacterium]